MTVASGVHLRGSIADELPVTEQFTVTVPRDGGAGTSRIPMMHSDEYGADGIGRTSRSGTARVRVATDIDRFPFSDVVHAPRVENEETETTTPTSESDTTDSTSNLKILPKDSRSTEDDDGFIDSREPGESTGVTFGVTPARATRKEPYPLSMDRQYDCTVTANARRRTRAP